MDEPINRRKKIKEMALLYANYLDVNELLKHEISIGNIQPLKYYLLPKEWLEDYKNKNDYDTIAECINPYMMTSFENFKALLDDQKAFDLNFSGLNIQLKKEIIVPPKMTKEQLQQQATPPNTFIPVKKEIVDDYISSSFDFFNKNSFLYDIIN